MTLFKPAENSETYLKMGIQGFQGSGKTVTAVKVAIGLHKYIGSKHPVYFYDTEKGSSYIKPRFDAENIRLERIQSRSFLTLISANKEIPPGAIYIIDSITHPWRDLMESFMRARGITRIKMNHWTSIKKEWGVFNDFFLNSDVHIIMCGRAGFEFDFEEDEEGNKELIKTGIKMKTEGELGFEPSLLIEMTAEKDIDKNKVTGITNTAFVLKDRFSIINGKEFLMPGFEDFLPYIKLLNLNGNHEKLENTDSSIMFSTDQSVSKRLRERDILIEELKNDLVLNFNPRTDEGKKSSLNFLKETFGTTSMTAIENMDINEIVAGKEKLKEYVSAMLEQNKQKPIEPDKKTKKGK